MSEAPPAAPPANPAQFVVEGPRRLSESIVWRLQREFYTRAGPEAWKPKGVPSFVTNNAFIARAYARLAVALLRDLLRTGALDARQPLHIFELGGGAGRFSYLFLRALQEERSWLPELDAVPLRYVLTDLVEANLQSARGHERLRPFVDKGLLDFARFDLEADDSLRLAVSGERIENGKLRNPALVIANYAFDSIRHDVYRVRSGLLQEALVTAVSSRREEDLDDPTLLERLRLRWEGEPLNSVHVYEDPLTNRVLAGYTRLADTSILIPTGALRCIRTVMNWSRDRILLVSGDKCVSAEEELATRGDPVLSLHGGCFSMTVNFDAIAAWFKAAGGEALLPSRLDYQFKVGAFLAGLPEPAETRAAFAREIDRFGPGEYFHLSYTLRKEHASPSLDVLLAAFKLGDWDPEMVVACRQVLTQKAKGAPAWFKQELSRGLDQAWERVFPMHRNLAMDLAWIALGTDQARQAIRFAQESLRLFGTTAIGLAVIGLAYATLGDNASALDYANRALELEPGNKAAQQLRATMTAARNLKA
jgi:tetratricopeptide (TPR) repeat protein